MIKINYSDKIKKWYANEVKDTIKGKTIGSLSNPILSDISNGFINLSENQIMDILITSRENLEEKYAWVASYANLCDFVGQYNEFMYSTKSTNKGCKKLQLEARKDYLGYLQKKYLNYVISEKKVTYKSITSNWINFTEVVNEVSLLLDEVNNELLKKFSYEFLTIELKRDLVNKINLRVCPYCNRQYIQPYINDSGTYYTGDLDHFYSKSLYILFSMSLWNIIPSCKLCNQTFKGVSKKPLLDPLKAGFYNKCFLKLQFNDVKSMTGDSDKFDVAWSIDPLLTNRDKTLIQNNIELFRLNEMYSQQKFELKNTLKRKHLCSGTYSEKIKSILGIRDEIELNRVIYGVSLDQVFFKDELLSKAIYDVVKNN